MDRFIIAPDCPLCSPSLGGLLWADDRLRVIRVDDTPYPGFVRVIWREHLRELSDLAPADRDWLMQVICQIETLQRDILRPDKINLASLGNQVPHLHWHLIPRWRDDPCFPDAIWATADQPPGHAADWAHQCAALAPLVQQLHHAVADMPG